MYWPNKQSISLNLEVANLFIQTYQKFFLSLENRTKQQLPIDILPPSIKTSLFLNVLIELEITLLDIIELNLNIEDINKLYQKILYDLINKIMKKFIQHQRITKKTYKINLQSAYNKSFFYENNYISQNLLIYLLFGSNDVQDQAFPFRKEQTPKYHVKALFENFIIQISNIVTFNLLENSQTINELSDLLINNYINNLKYQSIRDISNFQNNIFSYSLINCYIYYPQNIYCNQYQVWLLSSKGIIYKYVYANRYNDYLQLSTLQMNTIIYLEIQDFVIPKLNFLISLLGKLITYILLEIVSKSIQILLNQIIIRFSAYKK